MAPYAQRPPFDVHGLLRQCINEAGLSEKELYLGRVDASQWSGMMTGLRALDLVVLLNVLPLRVWMIFGPRMLAQIVTHWMQSKQQEVA